MRDMGNRIRQQRGMGRYFGGRQEFDMARQRANGEDIAFDRDPAKLSKLADIDNEFGRDQAQVHSRHQALAARQYPGLVAMRGEQLQRINNTGRADVSESRGFHCDITSPAGHRHFLELDGGNF